MKNASTDAAHTITAPASHVPTPSIERPSEMTTVRISEARDAISATPPSAPEPIRRS